MTIRPPDASVAISVKSSLKLNFPSASKVMAQLPVVILMVTTSPSPSWLWLERRAPEPPQPRSVSALVTCRDAAVATIAGFPLRKGDGKGGMVSIDTADDPGSAIRGAAAASGTTTTIAAIHAG